MILVDTGPLVALFDPLDEQHRRCRQTLREIRDRLRDFLKNGGLSVWFLDRAWFTRAFELMELYADPPMDLADASLVAAAEALGTRRVFTIDRKDFQTYRVRRGHRHYPVEIVSHLVPRGSTLRRQGGSDRPAFGKTWSSITAKVRSMSKKQAA
jgi:hypothetical protein